MITWHLHRLRLAGSGGDRHVQLAQLVLPAEDGQAWPLNYSFNYNSLLSQMLESSKQELRPHPESPGCKGKSLTGVCSCDDVTRPDVSHDLHLAEPPVLTVLLRPGTLGEKQLNY